MPEAPAGRRARLEAGWYSEARPGLALRLAAGVHARVLAARRRMYAAGVLRTHRVDRPVVVVGNLTVGGTGKSPLTAWLVRELQAQGLRPGIASRGYGRSSRGLREVAPQDSPADVGDEPLMLRQQTGAAVCVAERRVDAARALIALGCDLVVCDDGLQHLALARDLEIAVLDGARALGNGRLLPAGPLREPAGRLATVDVVVVNGSPSPHLQLPGAVRSLRMDLAAGDLLPLGGGQPRPLADLAGQAVHAVTGIGHPERFFDLLRAAGLRVQAHAFPDHHAFRADDIRFADALPVLLTSKDAVKCRSFADPRHWVLPVQARLAPEEAHWLVQRVLGLVRPGGLPA